MKGIFIPLLFAIFGGRAICEGNLPTGTDPNKVSEIYAYPQNTHPSKLSDAPITHGRELEVRGGEMNPSVTSPNNHDERRLDATIATLNDDITCTVQKAGVIGSKGVLGFGSTHIKAFVTCLKKGSDIKEFDINSCITNNNGNLGYNEKNGGFGDSCEKCSFEDSILKCECAPGEGNPNPTTINLNHHIVLQDNEITCKQKNEIFFITFEEIKLDQLILSSRSCTTGKTFHLKDCIAYDATNKNFIKKKENESSESVHIFQECKLDNWTLECKHKPATENPSRIDLNNFVDFTKCPLQCKERPKLEKVSII
jgi:hypothetical protein